MSTRRLILITGIGRNGGTLLDRLLGHLPGVVSLGEFRFVWLKGVLRNELCSCGQPFRECPFWQEVFRQAFGGMDTALARHVWRLQLAVDRVRYAPLWFLRERFPYLGRAYHARLRVYVALWHRLLEAVYTVGGAPVLVDSTKMPGYLYMLSHLPDVHISVVHLLRDSRGVAHSWTKRVRKPEVWDTVAHMRRYPPAATALRWLVYNALNEHLGRRVGRPYIQLRWEDFLQAPRTRFQALVAALDLPFPQNLFVDEHTVHLGKTHTSSGNPNRFRTGEIVLDPAKAQGNLAPWHHAVVTVLTFPLLRRYGYR